MHGFQWFKAQHNRHEEIYNNITTISRNKEIESVTSWRAAVEFDGFKPCNAQTVLLWCLWSGLEEKLRINCARFGQNLDSPLLLNLDVCFNLAMILLNSTSKLVQWCFRVTNQAIECDVMWRNWEKFGEKVRENFEKMDLDLKLWVVNPENSYGYAYICSINHA